MCWTLLSADGLAVPGARVPVQMDLGVRWVTEEETRLGGRAEENEPWPLKDDSLGLWLVGR